jgi:hypothetical protein
MNIEGVDVVIGVLLPLGIAVVNRSDWESSTKAAAALVICFLVATLASAVAGDITLGEGVDFAAWATTIGTIWGVAVVTYQSFWKPTNIAPAIEEMTG